MLFENIKSFDLESIKPSRTILLVTDQQEVAKEITKRYSQIYLFDGSEGIDKEKYEKELKCIVDLQLAANSENSENSEKSKNAQQNNICIHFQNCFHQSLKWTRNDDTRRLFMNHRFYGITILISETFVPCIEPGIRSQIDYVMISYIPLIPLSILHRFYQSYFKVFENFEMFKTCFQNLNSLNQRLLVFDRTLYSKDGINDIFLLTIKPQIYCFALEPSLFQPMGTMNGCVGFGNNSFFYS